MGLYCLVMSCSALVFPAFGMCGLLLHKLSHNVVLALLSWAAKETLLSIFPIKGGALLELLGFLKNPHPRICSLILEREEGEGRER